MKKLNLITLAIMSLSLQAIADDYPLMEKQPFVQIEEGWEVSQINLEAGLAGAVETVEARKCESCPLTSFNTTPATRYFANHVPIPSNTVMTHQGKGGLVVFTPETGEVVRIDFMGAQQ